MTSKIWILKSGLILEVKKIMFACRFFYHGNPGSRVLNFVIGYGLSDGDLGGHTRKGSFKYYNIFPGFIVWSIYCYFILNMIRMLLLVSMHRFHFKLKYGGQKIGNMTVF